MLGAGATTFSVGEIVSAVPNRDGRFPDVEHAAASVCRSLLRVPVDARALAALLLVAAEFSDGGNRVMLHFGLAGKPLLVTAENSGGQRFQSALMPLS